MSCVLSSREEGPDIAFGRPAFASFREPDGDCCENDHNIQNYLGGSDGGCSMRLCYRSKVRVGYSEYRCLSAESSVGTNAYVEGRSGIQQTICAGFAERFPRIAPGDQRCRR